MMIKERREAYVEVLEILRHMDKKCIVKIPRDLIEFFERNASTDYQFKINNQRALATQKLKESTINILAMLNINYWCEDENHKQELLKKYYNNDIKKQENLRNKYNVDNLFEKENKKDSVQSKEIASIIPKLYEDGKWYKKVYTNILKLIKQIFNKNR